MASCKSRLWKSGSTPPIILASSSNNEWTPRSGFQTNLTKVDFPCSLINRNVLTGHPSIMRQLLGRRSEEHTSELQSRGHLVCRLLLEKKNTHGCWPRT